MGNDSGTIYFAPAGSALNPSHYHIRPEDALGEGSIRRKCHDNLAAIELVQTLHAEDRKATDQEKALLVKYVGWGGIPQIFAWNGTDDWSREREHLKELLTPDQYEAARASTLNAHYTSPVVIHAIYDAVERLGFTHGRILEPALGVGNFFGLMPEAMTARSRLTGIEVDPISAAIAKAIYPDADIRNRGFEQFKRLALNDKRFDLAISNVPFGDYKLPDPQFDAHHFLIHDYFFAKGLEHLRPGGLMVFVTSRGTLDKSNTHLREYLADKADLIGAIRLPNNAFKQNANTEVTTDILFLRKLEIGESPSQTAWRNLVPWKNSEGESFQINEYFAAHPQMMLGRMAYGRMRYRNEPTLISDGRDLKAALEETVQRLPNGIYRSVTPAIASESEKQEPRNGQSAHDEAEPPDSLKENAFTIHNGALSIRTRNQLVPVHNLSKDAVRRIRGLIKVRGAVRDVLQTQLESAGEEALIVARTRLNTEYDQFTWRFGAINERANRRAFRGDPDLPLLCSLEDYDDETKRANKTAIFRERTIQPARPLQTADTVQDALVLCLNETGKVDLSKISSLLNRPESEFLPEMKGLIYRNPETNQWETDDSYLSGNVREKLTIASEAAATNPDYRENVTALEAVQPVDLTPSEIDVRLGAVWIPATDIEGFARALLDSEGVTVQHAAGFGTWFVQDDFTARGTIANTTEWGTHRYSALELIQDALNLKTPTVYDPDPKSDGNARIINPAQTEAARDKLEKIKNHFKTWIWEDDARRERLCRQYNNAFNHTRLRVFNGSHLTLPTSNPSIQLRPHQKDAVWRIVQSDHTLLAHVVGAGKTYTMVAAAIESKRLGLASKPMFAVPNHMLSQFSSELLALYPTANILVAGKEDFKAANRARLFSRIATGNWDAVIVTHSSFEKIPLSTGARKAFISEQIRDVTQTIQEQKAKDGTRMVKELERIKKRL